VVLKGFVSASTERTPSVYVYTHDVYMWICIHTCIGGRRKKNRMLWRDRMINTG